jgi:hypothetical protein
MGSRKCREEALQLKTLGNESFKEYADFKALQYYTKVINYYYYRIIIPLNAMQNRLCDFIPSYRLFLWHHMALKTRCNSSKTVCGR